MNLTTKSGKSVFPIGIGTWNMAMKTDPSRPNPYRDIVFDPSGEAEALGGLAHSLDAGQNHLDCAELYGGFTTDELVGKAIAGRPREDLFVADKLWKTSVAKGQVRPTVERMLEKLGTTYIDMLYIHAPWPDAPWREAIPQIDELIDAGLVRHWAVSNFSMQQMDEAQALSKHPLRANQMHYNLLKRDEVTADFLAYCREHEIEIVAYQPVKRQEVLANPVVQQVAERLNATPAQVALAWLIAQDTLPIPKATNPRHIDENIGAATVKLDEAAMRELDAIAP